MLWFIVLFQANPAHTTFHFYWTCTFLHHFHSMMRITLLWFENHDASIIHIACTKLSSGWIGGPRLCSNWSTVGYQSCVISTKLLGHKWWFTSKEHFILDMAKWESLTHQHSYDDLLPACSLGHTDTWSHPFP